MRLNSIEKIELEITSDCNAACPGCLRTQQPEKYDIGEFYLSDFQRIFPDRRSIENKLFKFCGVLGDPIKNKDCLAMVEYVVDHGGRIEISTNAGLCTREWWSRLGEIAQETKRVWVNFCIDGHRETNHLYRVNTNFNVIERNLHAYAEKSHKAAWVFIVFDHNEHELEIAKKHALDLGLQFAERTGMRNSFQDWIAKIKKRDKKTREIKIQEQTYSTQKHHEKKKQYEELKEIVDTNDRERAKKVVNSIECKLYHQNEIFISYDQRLWPCCFLWDNYVKDSGETVDKLDQHEAGWNDLKLHSIDEILGHPWFEQELAKSWNPEHPQHLKRCIKTCAYKRAYQNEFMYYEKDGSQRKKE